jgi:hypothetical protein
MHFEISFFVGNEKEHRYNETLTLFFHLLNLKKTNFGELLKIFEEYDDC